MTHQHVYEIDIRAGIEDVWHALTDPAATRQYFHATHWTSPPVAGQPFQTLVPDGRVAVDGVVEEVDPPHRLVHTWHPVYDAELATEPPSRVAWILTAPPGGVTHLRLVHDRLDASPLTAENVREGWVLILDSLRSLLETGAALPSDTATP